METSSKWLMGIGGWKAMKQARALVGVGAVISARRLPTEDGGETIEGVVAEGKRKWACGLRIRTTNDVDNLCGCRVSRRDGQICAHSLAAALTALEALASGKDDEEQGSKAESQEPSPPLPLPKIAVRVEFGPGLASHWAKGRVPVFVKADETRAPDSVDGAITRWLRDAGGGTLSIEQPAILSLDRVRAGKLFGLLGAGATRSSLEGQALRIGGNPARLRVEATLGGGDVVRLRRLPLDAGSAVMSGADGAWIHSAAGGALVPLQTPSVADAQALLSDGEATIEQPLSWFLDSLPELEAAFQLVSGPDAFLERISVRQAATRFEMKCEGSLNHLAASFRCLYLGENETCLESDDGTLIPDPGDPLRFYAKDRLAGERGAQQLREIGFSGPEKDGQFVMRGEDAILGFFAGGLPRLEADPRWDVEIGERFGRVTRNVARVEPVAELVGSGEDWFSFQLDYASGDGERIPRAEIQRLLQTGRHSLRLGDGRRAAVDLGSIADLGDVLYDCQPEQAGDGEYRVGAAQAGYLQDSISRWHGSAPSADSADPDFGDLDVLLRDYQKEGVRWLFAHMARASGGILADEMGLGKTVQTLATISAAAAAAAADADADGGVSALVVCPASLIHNWVNEARRFVPHLDVLEISGPNRSEKLAGLGAPGIVVTSYGLLVRDLEVYRRTTFAALVLDEASAIRNPKTKVAKAVRALNAHGRFALTGTPVENSVRDLWSIMEFVSPGYLGSADDFKRRYEMPITQSPEGSAAERERLRRRMRPFLLRRTKREVAPELPEKIESVRLCELTDLQAELYRTFLCESQQNIADMIKSKGFDNSRMHVLSTLLRLRQICCDPRLLEGMEARFAKESGKLDAFLETLDEAVEGGHRVLVFSQFAKMLGLLKSAVAARSVECCYLDGQTPTNARAKEVERFQQGEAPVFLISLKAGGYGLNLTAADTVIHYDPWWNPAVEAQATDRAHRIGQENPVTVLKLIARGTVEERILSLQRRKRSVIDAAVDDEAPMMRGLSQADMEEILADG